MLRDIKEGVEADRILSGSRKIIIERADKLPVR